jgi:hypothetical protein
MGGFVLGDLVGLLVDGVGTGDGTADDFVGKGVGGGVGEGVGIVAVSKGGSIGFNGKKNINYGRSGLHR